MYWPTRSSRVTATRCPLRTYPRRLRICAMRSATVVLPVPGLPVKLMCRLGAWASSPRFMRSLSITSSAAMSRMRALTGASPTRSRSSSSITASAWLSPSTSLTVCARSAGGTRAAAAPVAAAEPAPGGPSGAGAAVPGIEYMGKPIRPPCSPGRGGADQLQRAVDVERRLGMEADEIGARGREGLHQRIHRLHHQVHVEECASALRPAEVGLECRRHRGPGAEVGHEVVVHDVEMDPVGARGENARHFLAQAGEVGRENRWGDQVHDSSLSRVVLPWLPCLPALADSKAVPAPPHSPRSPSGRSVTYPCSV